MNFKLKKVIHKINVLLEISTNDIMTNFSGNLKKGPSFHFLVALTF